MAGPGDEIAAAAGQGLGHFRASHDDREQVIEVLKAGFAQGRLDKDEFDARVSQAFASRTYAELAAVTADIPAGPAAPPSRQSARTQHRAPGSRAARDVAIGSGVGLVLAAATVLGGFLQYTLLLLPLAFPFLVVAPFLIAAALASSRQRRSRGQLPPRAGCLRKCRLSGAVTLQVTLDGPSRARRGPLAGS